MVADAWDERGTEVNALKEGDVGLVNQRMSSRTDWNVSGYAEGKVVEGMMAEVAS